jgi:perosamine synthetase
MHRAVGYNYRMTNLQAAVGHAQFGKIERIIAAKRALAEKYRQRLAGRADLQLPVEKPYARNVYWMFHLLLKDRQAGRREEIMRALAERGIETRENFLPYNMQDIFIQRGWTRVEECPVANDVAMRGFYLPSSPTLADEDLARVCDSLVDVLGAP